MRQWLLQIDVADGQHKLAITDKGMVFLDKWMKLQQLTGLKNKPKSVDLQAVKASHH
jgi:hypothetical protein